MIHVRGIQVVVPILLVIWTVLSFHLIYSAVVWGDGVYLAHSFPCRVKTVFLQLIVFEIKHIIVAGISHETVQRFFFCYLLDEECLFYCSVFLWVIS